MLSWTKELINSMGYTGIVVLMVVENVFPPIPSEIVMPFSGFAAAQGQLALVGVVIAGTIGSVLGALPLYYIGKWVDEDRLKDWVDEHGQWLALRRSDIEKAQEWFEDNGRIAVFLCRLVPGVRSLISIPAGFARMNMGVFLLYTALGTGLWAALLAYAGYALGENYQKVSTYLGPVAYVVFGALAVIAVVWVVKRKRSKREKNA